MNLCDRSKYKCFLDRNCIIIWIFNILSNSFRIKMFETLIKNQGIEFFDENSWHNYKANIKQIKSVSNFMYKADVVKTKISKTAHAGNTVIYAYLTNVETIHQE